MVFHTSQVWALHQTAASVRKNRFNNDKAAPFGLEQSNITSDRSAVILEPLVLGSGRDHMVDGDELGDGCTVRYDPPCPSQRWSGGY